MEGRVQKRRRGEKEKEEECIASSDTIQTSPSVEECFRSLFKWLKEVKQILADDARTVKAIKIQINQKMEDALQIATQLQIQIQKEREEMKDKLKRTRKERGAVKRRACAKGRYPEHSNVRKRNEKLPISTTYYI
jgi:hypothetical protein